MLTCAVTPHEDHPGAGERRPGDVRREEGFMLYFSGINFGWDPLVFRSPL